MLTMSLFSIVTSSSSSSSTGPPSSSTTAIQVSSYSPPSNSTESRQINGMNDFTQQEADLILRERTKELPLSYPKIAILIGRGCKGYMVGNYAKKRLQDKLPNRKAGRPLTMDFTKEDDDRIVALYNNGMSSLNIATLLGTTDKIISNRLTRTLKSRIDPNRKWAASKTMNALTKSEIAAIKKSHEDGEKTTDDLAQQYGTSINIVRRVVGKFDCKTVGCTKVSRTSEGFCKSCGKKFDIEGYTRYCEWVNSYRRWRYANDPAYRLRCIVRNRLASLLSKLGIDASGKTASIGGGCTSGQLSRFVEQQFEGWMNWGNQGLYDPEEYERGIQKWQMDHCYPLGPFMTTENIEELGLEEVMKRANHWSNLQPLCAKKNNDKGDTIPDGFYWDVKQDRWLWEPRTKKTNWDLPSVESDDEDEDEDDEDEDDEE